MKNRNRLTKISISLLIVLSILLLLVACDDSSELKYSVNDDGETCTITGIGKNKIDDLVIPEEIDGYTVVAIADYAFLNRDFKTVVLPDSITQIGKGAFKGCLLLEDINIPQNVTVIHENTFYECESLEAIELPEGITDIEDFAFMYCENLISVELPSTLISIGRGAFFYCKLLPKITLPESLQRIEDQGFAHCYSLTEVYIPASVQVLDWCFASCSQLENINVDTNNKFFLSVEGVLYDYSFRVLKEYPSGKTSTSFAIPAYVTSIDSSAFIDNDVLNSIIIHKNVRSIGTYFVKDCDYLDTIYFDGTIDEWNAIDKLAGWDYYWHKTNLNYTIYCIDGTIAKDGTTTYYQ